MNLPWEYVTPVVASIVAGLLGIITTYLSVRPALKKIETDSRKTDAEEADLLSQSAARLAQTSIELSAPLAKHVAELEAINAEIRKRNRQLENEKNDILIGAGKLYRQIIALGETPVYEVPKNGNGV